MLKTLSLLIATSILFANCEPAVYTAAPDYHNQPAAQASVGFEVFYNELGPYGRWIDHPGEGYVWVPNVEQGFRPYATNGHWVYSNAGWTWSSNYSWGWAPFHYGRWLYEEGYGWIWVPGHEWSPAWVTWGESGGYYGWAPLAPHISIEMSMGGGWTPPSHYWNFVPREHINRTNINNYVINNTNNTTIINNIHKNVTIINNNTVNRNSTVNNNYQGNSGNTIPRNNAQGATPSIYNGPHVHDVEKATNNTITPVTIHAAERPNAGQLNEHKWDLYRPSIKPNTPNQNQSRPMPTKVEKYQPPHKENKAERKVQ